LWRPALTPEKEIDMQDFFPEIEVNAAQAEAMSRGLFAVARADGQVHEREAAIIAQFFGEAGEMASALAALERSPKIDGAALAASLPSPELRRLFIKTALLLGYADGTLSPGESKVIGEYAGALAVPAAELGELKTQAKEYLLSQLSHLRNSEALAEVAREIKD
jgi:tellurite resistance protein